jgi:hypothetical protein
MYADDLVLLGPSIVEMQTMLNFCVDELNKLDLNINPSKSKALELATDSMQDVSIYMHTMILLHGQRK